VSCVNIWDIPLRLYYNCSVANFWILPLLHVLGTAVRSFEWSSHTNTKRIKPVTRRWMKAIHLMYPRQPAKWPLGPRWMKLKHGAEGQGAWRVGTGEGQSRQSFWRSPSVSVLIVTLESPHRSSAWPSLSVSIDTLTRLLTNTQLLMGNIMFSFPATRHFEFWPFKLCTLAKTFKQSHLEEYANHECVPVNTAWRAMCFLPEESMFYCYVLDCILM